MRHHLQNCPVDYNDSVEQKLIHPKLLPPIDPAPDRSQNRSQYFTAALEGDHLRKVSFSVPVVAGVPFIVPEYILTLKMLGDHFMIGLLGDFHTHKPIAITATAEEAVRGEDGGALLSTKEMRRWQCRAGSASDDE
jgi:hypothetical protein